MKYLITSLAIFLIFLTSCGPTYQTYNNIYDLKKGDDYNSALERYKDYIAGEFHATYNKDDYDGIKMNILTSVQDMYEFRNSNSTHGHSRVKLGSARYYLIYKNKKLFTWGFLYELKRDRPELMKNIENALIDQEEN